MRKRFTTLVRICLCWAVVAVTLADDSGPTESPAVQWSLQPLPTLKQLSRESDLDVVAGSTQVIDQLVRRRLAKNHLSPAPRAEPHRQIRRLSLMLTGLPPEWEAASQFAEDPSESRYEELVDRYLDSPHFGERWARHWMDVVRYAETWGYEWNHLVRGAWRYRDYLIRAFNQDLPYDQLVREHIAGDLLDTPRVNSSLGINESLIGGAFYRFGETGHDDCVLYPAISLDVMDNQIDTLSKAFQALTVSCSRCHDHKLDEIPQRDYYAMLGIMASSRQVIRTIDLPGGQREVRQQLTAVKREIRSELAKVWMREVEAIAKQNIDDLLQSLRQQAEQEGQESNSDEEDGLVELTSFQHPLFAWHAMVHRGDDRSWQEEWSIVEKTIREEHAQRAAFNGENYRLFGDFTDPNNHHPQWAFEGQSTEEGAGFVAAGDFAVSPSGSGVFHSLLPAGVYSHGLSQKLNAAIRSPLLPEDKKFVSYQAMGDRDSVCRTVIANCTLPYFHSERFKSPKLEWYTVDLEHIRRSPLVHLKSYLEWATALDDQGYPVLQTPDSVYQEMLDNPRSYFGVTKVFLHDVDEPPRAELEGPLNVFVAPVSNLTELAARYQEILQTAVTRWADCAATDADVYWLKAFCDLGLLSRQKSASAKLDELVDEYRTLEERLETPRRIVGVADQDDGFDAPLLIGGDASSPDETVGRSYLAAIEPLISAVPRQTGSGRRRLAEMIASPDNPLTARVMANRIWHYLMGSGIVRSVDNFGNLGDSPSHPELLDYLARRLIDTGWSIKTVIREIVLSDAFRQSSAESQAGALSDPENRLFHRYPSRRLEAEVIRDAMLTVSGRLDREMFGPSVDPYRLEEIDARRLYVGPLDGGGRRSIYLKVTRMGPAKLLELFNFPDPSVTRGRRDATNVPAQALGLLNHPFVHEQAAVYAAHLLDASAADADFETILERLFMECFSRQPDESERREYAAFFSELAADSDVASLEDALRNQEVWKNLIHTIYNLKEFTYVL